MRVDLGLGELAQTRLGQRRVIRPRYARERFEIVPAKSSKSRVKGFASSSLESPA